MSGYKQIKLQILLNKYGEDEVKHLLSDFYCPLNLDVEEFIQDKAIVFDKQGISKTHLVFAQYKKEFLLSGYFTLAPKVFLMGKDAKISKTTRKRIKKFGTYISDIKKYCVSAPLIGQLGKNYKYKDKGLITGKILLDMACKEVAAAQASLGGNLVYLECEDTPRLVEFYQLNGFYNFGKRSLDGDEVGKSSSKYLIQMLKYLK